MSKIKSIQSGGFADVEKEPLKPKNSTTKKDETPKEEAPKEEKVEEKEDAAITKTDEELNIASIVDNFYEEQNKKEARLDIAGNYTLVIKHDLMARLDKLAEHYPRGFKSELVDKALETFVTLYEGKELPPKRKKRGRR